MRPWDHHWDALALSAEGRLRCRRHSRGRGCRVDCVGATTYHGRATSARLLSGREGGHSHERGCWTAAGPPPLTRPRDSPAATAADEATGWPRGRFAEYDAAGRGQRKWPQGSPFQGTAPAVVAFTPLLWQPPATATGAANTAAVAPCV